MDISTAIPTFAITLREGTEAALVVGIVLAMLQKSHQSRLKPWVYGGIAAGIGVSLLVGFLLSSLLGALQASDHPYASVIVPFLKLTFSLTAIALLTWMLVWMTQQAKTAKADIEAAAAQVLQTSSRTEWGIWTLIFTAVLREGLETVMFIVAQAQQGWMPVWGACVGFLAATGIGWGLFVLGMRINLRQFFQAMGIFLLLIVGGLVLGACKQIDLGVRTLDAIANLNWCPVSSATDAGSSCILGPLLWDARAILPEGQFPGVLLKTFLGYRDRIFVGQAVAYSIFMAVAGTVYWRSLGLPNLFYWASAHAVKTLKQESPQSDGR
ncbi:MAG TPA: FTR1 family protein [Stenomitos sp.]